MRVADAVKAHDWSWLAGYISGRLDCELSAELLKAKCAAILSARRNWNSEWADDTWLMWIRNRLANSDVFSIGQQAIPERPFTVEMHTFFLWLAETEEMLDRLRRAEPAEHPTEARSKIGKTNLVIAPIDRVAKRVAPTE